MIGARMMGGSFGGYTITLVKDDAIKLLIEKIKPDYESAMNLPLKYFIATIENGTERIN